MENSNIKEEVAKTFIEWVSRFKPNIDVSKLDVDDIDDFKMFFEYSDINNLECNLDEDIYCRSVWVSYNDNTLIYFMANYPIFKDKSNLSSITIDRGVWNFIPKEIQDEIKNIEFKGKD